MTRFLYRIAAVVIGLYFGVRFMMTHKVGPALHRIRRTSDIPVAMPDGVVLMTDVFAPEAPGPHPTLMMRLPYGRDGFAGIATVYARRGFNVVVQACRGTEASGGQFNPLVNERADGLATLNWLRQQPWFDGRLGLTGPSYLGYTQWAISDAPEVKAMAVKVTSAEFRSVVFPGGAFHLGLWLSWLQTIESLRDDPTKSFLRMITGDIERRSHKAALTLPLVDADKTDVGHEVWFWHEWFDTAIEDGPFWHEMDYRRLIGPDTPPALMMTGWYDFMVDQLLRDYRSLVEAGQRPYLTVSVSTHITGGHQADNPVDTLAWMRAHLMGAAGELRQKPVAIQMSGTGKWHEFEVFPPGPPEWQTRYLIGNGALSTAPALPGPPSRYRYDPADPTPNLGGAIFAFTGAGPVWQRPLEARPDVIVFTSGKLDDPLTVMGNVEATIHLRSSNPHVDLFVRLCEVNPFGVSINICDAFQRLTPDTPRGDDDVMTVSLRLHATAHCFERGHRLRIQVSSGAFPRYARNTGTGEPVGDTTRLVPAEVEILHDHKHKSAIRLPVYRFEA